MEIIDTTFRDAHQSLIATRMGTMDMLPIAEKMDSVGFYSMEVWGGATFDVSIRYLREDPWERLKTLRERIHKTKLQMLIRGQNIVGYKHYPDDVVKKFVELAYKNGVDIFRVFDALNDVRNMRTAIKTAKKLGAEVQGAISYTTGKIFTDDYYLNLIESLIALDVDYITIKDMAGLLTPMQGYELVKRIKEKYQIKVNVHMHSTSGMAVATYLMVSKAGADLIDTAISPLAFGTAQPGIQSVYAVLPEDEKPNINIGLVYEIEDHIRNVVRKYDNFLRKESLIVNPYVLKHMIPGGMFSNLLHQLNDMNALDKLDMVLKEVPRVREELGYPPLVTPTSQIVGTQAVMNVLFGRYKKITKQTKDYVRGLYGKPPGKIDEKIKRKIIGDEEPITKRPADLLSPMLKECEKYVVEKGFYKKEEDIITYCLFPNVAEEFFSIRNGVKEDPKINNNVRMPEKKYRLYYNGKSYEVGIEEIK